MSDAIKTIAEEQWNITIDADDASASIWRDDPQRRGCRIGPIATVPLGIGSQTDDGTPTALLREGEDGATLWAVQQVPAMLRLLRDVERQEVTFNAARRRAVAILDRIRNRPDELPSGDVYEVRAES